MKLKGWTETDTLAHMNQEKTGEAILIVDKEHFRKEKFSG